MINEAENLKVITLKEFKQNLLAFELAESLSNYVYICTLENGVKVVIKIPNGEARSFFSFNKAHAMTVLQTSGYIDDLVLKVTPQYEIENFLEGRKLTLGEFKSFKWQIELIKKISDFHYRNKIFADDILLIIQFREKFLGKVITNIKELVASEEDTCILAALDDMKDFIHSINENDVRGGQKRFSHNDLLIGNIIYNGNELHFIDFEYSGCCFCFNDVYNILIESTYEYNELLSDGFSKNDQNFASNEDLLKLITFYLKSYAEKCNYNQDLTCDSPCQDILQQFWFAGMIVNVYWSLWALGFKRKSSKFNYSRYGMSRYRDYLECKMHYYHHFNEKA